MAATISIQTGTGYLKPISTKISAAIIQSGTQELAREVPKAIELGLQAYCYNLTNKGLPPDQAEADQMMSFATAVGVRVDVISDILINGWQNYLKWSITQFKLKELGGFAVCGFETIDEISETDYIALATEYISICKAAGVNVCLDAGLIYRQSRNSQERIDACAQIIGAVDERQYVQVSDRVTFTSDMNHNFSLLKTYLETTLPFEWLDVTNADSCIERMPQDISCLQWHWQDFGTGIDYVTGTPLSAWGAGKMAIFVLTNTDKISYLCHMSNNNLYSNPTTPNPNWYDLKRIAQCFRYKNSLPVTFTGITGLSGRAFSNDINSDGTRDYALLVTNETGTTYTLPTTQVALIGGGKIQGSITRDTGHGDRNWNPPTINDPIVSETDFTIKGYSTTVFKFKGKKVGKVAGS